MGACSYHPEVSGSPAFQGVLTYVPSDEIASSSLLYLLYNRSIPDGRRLVAPCLGTPLGLHYLCFHKDY